ncbi:hypothetical protein BFW01_g5944 [Lasiodiplodia theobromae]|nr:hypothetical protein BFW01_g5944 [Lasiodiplodia theobromae]
MYPDVMKDIEEAEKIFQQFHLPEPFDLPPLPSGSGPMSQHHENYNYDDVPLPTRSSIRLVSVEPTPNNNINVSLRTVDLLDNPSYTTLSYTWGPPLSVFRTDEERRKTQSQIDDPRLQTTVPITCNGRPLRVTENLYRFLCRWRDGSIHASFAGDEIWIDAICINQTDADEKNIQVAKMGEIYSKSQGAYIWLGEEDCFSRVAVPLLHQLAMFQGDWNSLRERGALAAERELLDRGLPSTRSWDFMCLFAFLRRAWFRRAWICQEISFAPKLSIFCGGAEISDWRIMAGAATYLFLTSLVMLVDSTAAAEVRGLKFGGVADVDNKNPYDLGPPVDDPSHRKLFCSDTGGVNLGSGIAILYLENIRTADGPKGPVDGVVPIIIEPAPPRALVIELFKSSRWMQATNPRDKVYAFLDLAKRPCYNTTKPHPDRRELEPRYHLEVKDVYLEASWYLLLTEQNLGLLSCSEQGGRVNKDMPSWVADWEASTANDSFTMPLHEPDWRASGDSTWEVPRSKLYQPSLTVRGWKISIISAAVQGEFCLSKAALIAAGTPEIYRLAVGSQSRVEALWRTLVADHVDRQNPALPHCEQDFRRLWAWELEKARRRCEEGTVSSTDAKETLQCFQHAEDKLHILPEKPSNVERLAPANAFDFISRFNRTSLDRTVFRTDANHLGNGTRQLKVGDQVWILAGANVPFVLRPQSCGGYQLVGEAYVHGIMRGEALDRPGARSEQIELV